MMKQEVHTITTNYERPKFSFIPPDEFQKLYFVHNRDYDWPGFYCGSRKWTKPTYNKKHVVSTSVTWDSKDGMLYAYLRTIGIDVYSDIQIKS